MKSEERHQLLTNDLQTASIKTASFIETHAITVVAAVCGLLLVGGIGYFWSQAGGAENEEAWYRLDTAKNLEEFDEVARKYKGTPPAIWARLQVAEQNLQNAIPLMFTNRELAVNDLKSAATDFEALLAENKVPAAARERALWGIARCLETTCDGDTTKAIEAYQRLIREYPDTIYKLAAEDRIQALKSPNAADFYAWFSKENPKPQEVRPKDFDPNAVTLPSPSEPKDPADEEDKPVGENKQPAPSTPPATSESSEKKPEETKPAEKAEGDKPADAAKPEEPAKPAEPEKPAPAEPAKDAEKPKE